jgi:transcriptional regulator with XRE-family HTH domain
MKKTVDIANINSYIMKTKEVYIMELKDYLVKKRVTLKEFAGQSGLGLGYISGIQNKKQKPSRDAIIAIHKATKGEVTFKDLVDLEEKKEVVA